MIAAAKMVARHLPNVLTYFNHRICNAMAEGLNSKIATIQKRACGYRKTASGGLRRCRRRCMPTRSGLSLYCTRTAKSRPRIASLPEKSLATMRSV